MSDHDDMRLGSRFRFVWYLLLTGAAGWVATAAFVEDWKPWGPVITAAAAGATGTFIGEVINARRRITEAQRRPRSTLANSAEPSASDFGGPAALLRPEQAVVTFTGRKDELAWLQDWCANERACPVALITGPGGVGKTRLAWELGKHLPARKWLVQPVQSGHEVTDVENAAQAKERVLLVIDYAETRSNLSKMLTEVARCEKSGNAGRFRVLLLARQIGEWWSAMDSAPYATRVLRDRILTRELAPALDADHDDNRRVFAGALRLYAKARGRPVPTVEAPVSSETLPVLVLHAAALVAVLDDEQDAQGGRASADLVLDKLLEHESRLWLDTARHLGLNLGPSVMSQVIAVVALLLDATSSTETALHSAIRRVPDLIDADAATVGAITRWLRQLYPADGDKVDILRPDLLAERHAANELTNRRLLHNCFQDLPESQQVQALTVLSRACTHHDQANTQLNETLHHNLAELAESAITATLQASPQLGDRLAATLADTTVPDATLRDIQAKIPYPTVALASANLVVTHRIYDALEHDAPPAEMAEWATELATALVQNGRRIEEALELITEAVTLYRGLTEMDQKLFLPKLAESLNDQSTRLANLGRFEQALEAIEEATSIRRKLAKTQPDAFIPVLAGSLNNQSTCLSDLGRLEQALEATNESVQIYRELAAAQPDASLPELAGSLNNQANCLEILGRFEQALEAIEEATNIRRKLAKTQPDAFYSHLATSLNNQANCLANLSRPEQALEAIEEATNIRRKLAKTQPDAFIPVLAGSLNNQSTCLSDLGRLEQALEATNESVEIYRELAKTRPDTHLPDLAMSLNNQATCQSELGRSNQALKTINESVEIYRELAKTRPDTHLPDLAMSLNNQAICQSGLVFFDKLKTINESVEIYRELAKARPDTHLPDLAMSLNNQANRHSALGRFEQSLDAISESVEIYRELAKTRPDTHLRNLANSLNNLALCQWNLGFQTESLAAIEEAITHWKSIAAHRPAAHRQALNNALVIRKKIKGES